MLYYVLYSVLSNFISILDDFLEHEYEGSNRSNEVAMPILGIKNTLERKETKSSAKELRLINLDLLDLSLFMFTAQISSMCFTAAALTPSEDTRKTQSRSYQINQLFLPH